MYLFCFGGKNLDGETNLNITGAPVYHRQHCGKLSAICALIAHLQDNLTELNTASCFASWHRQGRSPFSDGPLPAEKTRQTFLPSSSLTSSFCRHALQLGRHSRQNSHAASLLTARLPLKWPLALFPYVEIKKRRLRGPPGASGLEHAGSLPSTCTTSPDSCPSRTHTNATNNRQTCTNKALLTVLPRRVLYFTRLNKCWISLRQLSRWEY